MSTFDPGFPGGPPALPTWPPPPNELRDLSVAAILETQGVDAMFLESGDTFKWPIRIRIQRSEDINTGNFFDEGLSLPKYFPDRGPEKGDWITTAFDGKTYQVLNHKPESSRVLLQLVEKTK